MPTNVTPEQRRRAKQEIVKAVQQGISASIAREGHPLLVTTHRGDQHLIVGLPSIIARYEDNEVLTQVKRIIVDREGMATEFLADLQANGRTVVTILRSNLYQDLTSGGRLRPGSAGIGARSLGNRLTMPYCSNWSAW